MRRLNGFAAVIVLTAGIISGCSGGSSDDEGERPGTSDVTIDSSGYAYRVPAD